MGIKQKILLSFAVLILLTLFFLVIFGDNGLSDLSLLKQERHSLVNKNRNIARKNLSFHRKIDRLEHDLTYIETVARQELGVIGKDEVILKIKESGSQKQK